MNMFLRSFPEPLIGDVTSSIYRMSRVARVATAGGGGGARAPLETTPDILDLLGDSTLVNGYAIRRQNTKVDPYITLVTVLIDLHAKTLALYTGNPKSDPGPPASPPVKPDIVFDLTAAPSIAPFVVG
jgi:hypothetical protein